MDLSHWDLVERFSMWEAACLSGGVDPNLMERPSELEAKVKLIYREMAEAYEMAYSNALMLLTGMRDPDETEHSVFMHGSLPSMQLGLQVRSCILSGRDFNTERFGDDFPQTFSREELDAWFKAKGFKSAYSFLRASKGVEIAREPQIQKTDRHYISDKLAKMNQAALKFWGNADRDDRGTHPDNAKVAAWLVSQDFSPTLADKAATIIRPEWVPTGRRPDE